MGSGGQKQRIAIARAVYSRAEIVIFDDPLSAMDAHVGKHVFEKVFLDLLKDSCVLFFTNQLQFCEHCSQVYMLDNLKLVEFGAYQHLSSKPDGAFATLLKSVVG